MVQKLLIINSWEVNSHDAWCLMAFLTSHLISRLFRGVFTTVTFQQVGAIDLFVCGWFGGRAWRWQQLASIVVTCLLLSHAYYSFFFLLWTNPTKESKPALNVPYYKTLFEKADTSHGSLLNLFLNTVSFAPDSSLTSSLFAQCNLFLNEFNYSQQTTLKPMMTNKRAFFRICFSVHVLPFSRVTV